MRNPKTKKEIAKKLWGRYASQYDWHLQEFHKAWLDRWRDKSEDRIKDYNPLPTLIRELRVLKFQMMVSNINWSVFGLDCPRKWAEELHKHRIKNKNNGSI